MVQVVKFDFEQALDYGEQLVALRGTDYVYPYASGVDTEDDEKTDVAGDCKYYEVALDQGEYRAQPSCVVGHMLDMAGIVFPAVIDDALVSWNDEGVGVLLSNGETWVKDPGYFDSIYKDDSLDVDEEVICVVTEDPRVDTYLEAFQCLQDTGTPWGLAHETAKRAAVSEMPAKGMATDRLKNLAATVAKEMG